MARDAGGSVVDEADADPVRVWRDTFINMPYRWNETAGLGLVLDTFESAITWDRWPAFDAAVRAAVEDALVRVCGRGELSCRFTHVYPDGPAPYYTFNAPGRRGSELSMWAEIKGAASDAVIAAGRYDYAPSRRWERPQAVVRRTAAAALRRCPEGLEEVAGPRRRDESGCPDRHLNAAVGRLAASDRDRG